MTLLDEEVLPNDQRSLLSLPSSAFSGGSSEGSGQSTSPPRHLTHPQAGSNSDHTISGNGSFSMPTTYSGTTDDNSSTSSTTVGGSTPTSQLVSPPPGLPHSSSTAELVALGLISTNGSSNTKDSLAYDPRASNGGMVGSPSGGNGGLEDTGSGGAGQSSSAGGSGGGDMSGNVSAGAGTGSAGGMGLGLRNHSLTNLANMVRSQSVSSFHTDLFNNDEGGNRRGDGRMMSGPDGPAWGSYPANLDKAAASAHTFMLSPGAGSLSGSSRGAGNSRPPPSSSGGGGGGAAGGGSGGGSGGDDLSPAQFTGRGTAPRREVERGVPAWSSSMRTSQRRQVGVSGSGMDHGGMPAGRPGGGAPSGRAMVHNRSDTDLVASFSRLGFGNSGGGISRWSPQMSPTASPLGAPLLEEDPLDLELEETGHKLSGGGGGDTFVTSLRSGGGRRGLTSSSVEGGPGLPRHASYPSLALSRGGYGMEEVVQGAFEDLSVGEGATGGEGSGSGSRVNGRVAASAGGSGMSAATPSGSMTNDSFSPAATQGPLNTLSPAHHALSPASTAQRPQGRGGHASRHRPHGGGEGARADRGHSHRPNPHSTYDQGRGGGSGGGAGGVDGVMMSDGRFVPTSQLMAEGGHPGLMYPDGPGGYGGPGGYDGMGGGGHQIDAPWGAQDPVSLYQALLMKQSLAAAHASGMRFPSGMPGNGMGMNMNMADIAAFAAAQAAAGRGGGYGGGGYGGYPGGGMDYGRRDGMRGGGGGGGRGGMGVVDVGVPGYMMGMPDVRGGGMMGMGRGGGMYDIVEDVGDGNVYQVQFKRSTRNFLLGKTCQRDLQVSFATELRFMGALGLMVG